MENPQEEVQLLHADSNTDDSDQDIIDDETICKSCSKNTTVCIIVSSVLLVILVGIIFLFEADKIFPPVCNPK